MKEAACFPAVRLFPAGNSRTAGKQATSLIAPAPVKMQQSDSPAGLSDCCSIIRYNFR